jgi:hypothetical protein
MGQCCSRDVSVLDAVTRLFMQAWYRSREAALESVPFPIDPPVTRVPGSNAIRVLLLGNGAASGWGVKSHDLALPGRLARTVADLTGRGVHLDARVDRMLRLGDLQRLLHDDGHDLARYDVIVLLAGMSDAVNLTPLPRWERSMRQLLDRFRNEAPSAAVLVLGPQAVHSVSTYTGWPSAIAERHRVRMNTVTASLCAVRNIRFEIMPDPSRTPGEPGHRSPGVYHEWAVSIGAMLAPLVPAVGQDAGPQDELERQLATEAMLPDAPPDPRLDRITQLARTVFGVKFAAISMVDGDWQKNRSVAGAELAQLPRAFSMCDYTIRGADALVIADLSEDRRFDGNPAVHGDEHLRFYAGYPIESPDGYRVGALCILDTSPHRPEDIDTGALSDLALLAQKELWASIEAAGAPLAER